MESRLLVASLVVEFASVPASAVESDVDREAQRVAFPAGVVTTPPTVAIPRPDRHLSSWTVSSRQSARQPTAPSFQPEPSDRPNLRGCRLSDVRPGPCDGGPVAVASVSNSSTCGSAVIERTIRCQGHQGRHGCRGGSCQPGSPQSADPVLRLAHPMPGSTPSSLSTRSQRAVPRRTDVVEDAQSDDASGRCGSSTFQ